MSAVQFRPWAPIKQRLRINVLSLLSFRSFLGSFGLTLQQQFNVVLAKTVMELNGISCLPLEEVPPTRQQIIASRSFGLPVTTFEMLSEAVASHTRPGGGQAAAGGGSRPA